MSGTVSINGLHAFHGHPAEFWPEFCAFSCKEVEADSCTLVVRQGADWRILYRWPTDPSKQAPDSNKFPVGKIANAAVEEGVTLIEPIDQSVAAAIGLHLEEADSTVPCVAIFLFTDNHPTNNAALEKLRLLADAPAVYQRFRQSRLVRAELESLAEILDLQLLLTSEQTHLAACMTLANEAAARYRCSRVSVGWIEDGYVRVKAISQMEKFEPKMEVVSSLEAAMEEAVQQDEEVIVPAQQQDGPASRDHDEYSRRYNVEGLLSLPLRSGGQPVGVLTCERQDEIFNQDDIETLRILCDQVASPLKNIRDRDRGIFTQLKDSMREKLSGLLGIEHTLAKLFVILAFLMLVAGALIKVPYRIEAPFILRSEDVRQVTTPFEGFIDNVEVRIGQLVNKGDLLLTLDSRDLRLQESAAVANQVRFMREVEKARASGSLVEMKIAQAQFDQASAQLELVRHRLSLAKVETPIDGIIVEGDLEQLRGAPVEAGDILFKVARHELLFIEAKFNEEDIHELSTGQAGEIAFVSRPDRKYPFRVDMIDPVAITEGKRNIFLARGRDLQDPESWWRPGMSGIAKVDVGKRSLLWIATHRTIDFFQMLMWW